LSSVINEAGSSTKNLPAASPSLGPEKTTIKSLGLCGTGGGVPCAVDARDGKIVRIRPLHFDSEYDPSQFNAWKIRVRGKTLVPLLKSLPSPFSLAYKKRTYSPNRINCPLKRVDWDPAGERNPQNRGKSKYQRISWDEASELISGEIKRVHNKYGPLAIMVQVDGHGESKTVHYVHGNSTLLLDKLGGFTQQVRNPDSWEGWYYGSKHVWGEGYRGLMRPADNTMKDISENSGLVLYWGCDPETTPWGFSGQSATHFCYFWSEIGIKQVYICPDLNYGAAVHADKWIPVLPNTDVALQLAIIYVWISEGIYDKEYIDTHTVGFDRVKAYVMGEEDGLPKTPEWASGKCGVPEWTIKALARDFASKRTSIAHYYGGSYVRGPYSHEPARLECILLGMQGLGKPGIHQFQIGFNPGMPRSLMPMAYRKGMGKGAFATEHIKISLLHELTTTVYGKQYIPKTLIQEAILNPPITFTGTGALAAPVEDQFKKYSYPLPREEGGTEIHMIWTDTPCRTTCWNDGNKTVEALRDPKIECIIAQHPWLENDTLLADLILPSNTTLEVDDILSVTGVGGSHFSTFCLQRQSVKPVGESKSDYEIVVEIAKKFRLEKEVTEGRTIEDWIRYFFEKQYGLPEVISWEELEKKGYYVCPVAPDWEQDPAGLKKFYDDPAANPLLTPSGKLEFYSERLAANFPEDLERPPIPKWIEKGVTHDERLSSERARPFPLLLMSNHGRWRVHSQCDDISWTREAPTCKVKGPDGYLYEPAWIHPSTAAKRDIKSGDIVRVFNERGAVLAGTYVTERIMPGVVYMDHGARVDFIIPGKLDRGGAVNLISPTGTISKNCIGQATSGYLVQVEKVTADQMEEWKRQYPEAFNREYDASGIKFDAWITGEPGG
jgi:molybdopterin guanine dinucleotide-containing S/N-oxide reductase-like protein